MTARAAARSLVLLVVSGTALLLAGCSSSPSSTGASTAAPPTSIASPGASVPVIPADNARAEVTPRVCADTANGWVLRGTVKNPGPGSKRFQIVVDYVSRVGSTVLATTVLNLPSVPARGTASWSAVGAKGKSNVNCVVRLAQST